MKDQASINLKIVDDPISANALGGCLSIRATSNGVVVSDANGVVRPLAGQEYTINNNAADSNGNFSITASELEAAPTVHTHAISDVTGLQTQLDGKSPTNHTHRLVQSLNVGDVSISDAVKLVGGDNVSLETVLNTIYINVNAQAAGAYKQADMYADSAIRAFNWGVNNLAHIECTLNSIDYTFDEPDSKVSDRTWLRYRKQIMFWAAGQMYLLTKDLQYTKYLTDEYWNEYKAVFDVDDSFFKNVFWELAETDLTPYSTYMRQWIISRADRWIGYQEQYAYRDMSFPPGNNYAAAVAWGNCHPNARGQLYAVAYHLTGDEKYRTAIQHGVNWLTGCNALGRTLTTGVGKVSPVRILSKIDQLLRESTGYHDPVPGITCFTYGTNCLVSEAVNNTYLLSKSARSDSNYTGCNINLMPGKLRSSVSTGAGPIAVYMRDNLPMWRSYVPLQDYAVSMNEFTVSETMGGNLLLLAPLLEDAWTPESDWKARTPVPDPKQLEGYVFLP